MVMCVDDLNQLEILNTNGSMKNGQPLRKQLSSFLKTNSIFYLLINRMTNEWIKEVQYIQIKEYC